jgi:hypothetical protein
MRLNQKVTDDQIRAALADGLNQSQIARRFGLSKAAVGERVARLRALVRVPAGEVSGSGDQAGHLDTMGQLAEINREAVKLLRKALKGDDSPGVDYNIILVEFSICNLTESRA